MLSKNIPIKKEKQQLIRFVNNQEEVKKFDIHNPQNTIHHYLNYKEKKVNRKLHNIPKFEVGMVEGL